MLDSPLMVMADSRLEEWGKRAMAGAVLRSMPPVTMLGRIIEQGPGASRSGRPPVSMPESEMEVDRAVSGLPPHLHNVCMEEYTTYGDLRSKAKKLRLSMDSYKNRLNSVKRRVGAALEG